METGNNYIIEYKAMVCLLFFTQTCRKLIDTMKKRLFALFTFLLFALGGWFLVQTEDETNSRYRPFKYGLDLQGGVHLGYKADVSDIAEEDIAGAMISLKETIERRVNLFGVSEPLVQTETSLGSSDANKHRLIVELPGVTDLNQAIEAIGATPILEFRLLDRDVQNAFFKKFEGLTDDELIPEEEVVTFTENLYVSTGLTGALLDRALVQFLPPNNQPAISLRFNSEGKDLFKQITEENTGEILAIFLDGILLTQPVIQQVITNGEAQITGQFSVEEAQTLVRDLNFGALPVPVELIETQVVGPTLGKEIIEKGVFALLIGLGAICLFLIFWYRVWGVVATIALSMYVLMMLLLFKFLPVTITASGIAGLILSLGMAVDANILIFERVKEELAGGANPRNAIKAGTDRAWSSIRDGNLSSLISAVILFYFSGASIVKGFALVFALGVLVSMFTAIVVTKTLALGVVPEKKNLLFGTGFKK